MSDCYKIPEKIKIKYENLDDMWAWMQALFPYQEVHLSNELIQLLKSLL